MHVGAIDVARLVSRKYKKGCLAAMGVPSMPVLFQ